MRRLEAMGRYWEAAAWCEVHARENPAMSAFAGSTMRHLGPSLVGCDAWTVAEHAPSRRLDLSGYPLPSAVVAPNVSPIKPAPVEPALETAASAVTFTEDAKALGLDFTYVNGAPRDARESLFEMNGGGVAVLDYDGDGRQDVYFTQGGALPPAALDGTVSDRLMRQREGAGPAGVVFEDVSGVCGLRDKGYGQGVTIGDWNDDGFPDIYVANIGPNQLYLNQGDGTYVEVAEAAGVAGGGWTSSCVLADLNGDRWPDLYAVTYLEGDELSQPCRKDRVPRCSPLGYAAAADRFYLNLGDGRFEELSERFGLQAADGRGLGVVAADLDGSRRLSLFVSNDMSANFLFRNRSPTNSQPVFVEQALLDGVAFDGQGQAKACMGIAAGDATGDGRLDLFVTNYYRQSNDFYVQQADGTFRDESRTAQLYEPGFLQLGWGAQFLDVDANGWLDLMVANGHVHDPRDPAIPYDMRAQLFRNTGRGRFEELVGVELGPAFHKPRAGRALARWDWNRDGLDDAIVSHLNQPATVATNRTPTPNRRVALRFAGVDSPRDALGTTVVLMADGRSWMRQLTAGDGFQASNERRLMFGVGPRIEAVSIVVTWPSGTRQEFKGLPSDCEWLLIEGQSPRRLRDFADRP